MTSKQPIILEKFTFEQLSLKWHKDKNNSEPTHLIRIIHDLPFAQGKWVVGLFLSGILLGKVALELQPLSAETTLNLRRMVKYQSEILTKQMIRRNTMKQND